MKKHTQQPKKNQQVLPVAELSSETSPKLSKLSESELAEVCGGTKLVMMVKDAGTPIDADLSIRNKGWGVMGRGER